MKCMAGDYYAREGRKTKEESLPFGRINKPACSNNFEREEISFSGAKFLPRLSQRPYEDRNPCTFKYPTR